MALAYRIYCYANPLGWDCTATEVADAIRSTPRAVAKVASLKGWSGRLRTNWTGFDGLGGWRPNGCNEGLFPGEAVQAVKAHYARLADEAAE
jgi:hypothetical protein